MAILLSLLKVLGYGILGVGLLVWTGLAVIGGLGLWHGWNTLRRVSGPPKTERPIL